MSQLFVREARPVFPDHFDPSVRHLQFIKKLRCKHQTIIFKLLVLHIVIANIIPMKLHISTSVTF